MGVALLVSVLSIVGLLSGQCGADPEQQVWMQCSQPHAQDLEAAAECVKTIERSVGCSKAANLPPGAQSTNRKIEFRLNLELPHGQSAAHTITMAMESGDTAAAHTITMAMESGDTQYSMGSISYAISNEAKLNIEGGPVVVQTSVAFVVLLCGIGENFTIQWTDSSPDSWSWFLADVSMMMEDSNGGWAVQQYSLKRENKLDGRHTDSLVWELAATPKVKNPSYSARLKRGTSSSCFCQLRSCTLVCPRPEFRPQFCPELCLFWRSCTLVCPRFEFRPNCPELCIFLVTSSFCTCDQLTSQNAPFTPTTMGIPSTAMDTTMDTTVDITSTTIDITMNTATITMDTISTATMDTTTFMESTTMDTTESTTIDTTESNTMDITATTDTTTSATMETTTNTATTSATMDTMSITTETTDSIDATTTPTTTSQTTDSTSEQLPTTAEQINASSLAIQHLFESVLRRQDFNVMTSSQVLSSLAVVEYIEEVPIDTDDLLNTISALLKSLLNISSTEERTLIASQLLRTLDIIALRTIDEGLHRVEGLYLNVSIVDSDIAQVDAISVQGNRIVLPNEILGTPTTANVTIASILYNDFMELLPGNFNGSNETSLVSPVISSALLCGDRVCDTSSIRTRQPVRIELAHRRPEDSSGGVLNCVFWEFTFNDSGAVTGGKWSDRGCELVSSNSTLSICQCNHLTHFAILLSPRLDNISEANRVALRVIGYLGVSISLVTLTITVLILTCVKSLWNMRTYVHIHLCLSLMAAQLVFVAGVDKTSNTNACSAVAVLLHYLYLVSFMWMPMEGVVLYVVLVKVFIQNSKKYYLIMFTVLSYGLPLLYMGLTVPLGFLRHEQRDYGYDAACWLQYTTNFIWSFIAPVIVIIMINSGFFVMVLVIMCKQRKRLAINTSKLAGLRSWLKSSISLMIVMGLTWIVGVLFFNRDLLPFAYIFTILVAFQGLAIFVICVLLSPMVEAALLEWLRKRVNGSSFLSSHFGDKINSWANKSKQVANPETEKRKGPEIQLGVHIVKNSSHSSSNGGSFTFGGTESILSGDSETTFQTDYKQQNCYHDGDNQNA